MITSSKSDETYAAIREKANIRTYIYIKNSRQRYRESSEWINSSSWKACAWN